MDIYNIIYIILYKMSNILILTGIKLSDCVPTSGSEINKIIGKEADDALPDKFVSAKEWRKITTKLLCWNCSLSFNTYPKFIPEAPTEDECLVYGCFCSWNCAMRFIDVEYDNVSKTDAKALILEYASKLDKTEYSLIVPSPPRYIMSQYKGSLGKTIYEYKTLIDERNKTI